MPGLIFNKCSVIQMKLPAGDRSRIGIVRDHQERHAKFPIKAPQQSQNMLRRIGIKVAGGFVCNHDLGMGDNGSTDADSLLLPARELSGVVVGPIQEADRLQGDFDPLAPLRP